MDSTSIAMVIVVAIAIAGFIAYQHFEAQRRAAAARDPASLIGSGIGNLVSGIIGAATS